MGEILVLGQVVYDLKIYAAASLQADVIHHKICDELSEQQTDSVLNIFCDGEIVEHPRTEMGARIPYAHLLCDVDVAVFFGQIDYKTIYQVV